MVTWGYGIIWQRGSWLPAPLSSDELLPCRHHPGVKSASARQTWQPASIKTKIKFIWKVTTTFRIMNSETTSEDLHRKPRSSSTLQHSESEWLQRRHVSRVRFFLLCFILILFRFLSAPFQRVDKLSASASTFNVACTHYRKQRPAILWYWTSFTALISHKNTILWPQRDTMHRIFQHFWSSWNKKKENIEATRQFSSPIVSIERGARLGSDCRLIPAPAFRW